MISSKNRSIGILSAVFGLITGLLAQAAPDVPSQPSKETLEALASSLKWQTGTITLRNGLAKINLTNDFRYLDHNDAEKVLHDIWGNPPDPDQLGMIFPANAGPLDRDGWGVIISYEEGGYVKDDDAQKINYSDLLKQMQKSVHDINPEREKEGYPAMELTGWAAPPHYDQTTHKLYWAKEFRVADEPVHTLNYNIRVLGRHGVLILNAVASMRQFPEIDAKVPEVLSMVDFQPGNLYTDFDPKVDKVAKYGLAALIVGGALGAAAKFGLLKGLWVAILALKKFIIIGVVAVIAFFKKIFGGFSGQSKVTLPSSQPPNDPPPPAA